MPPQPSKPTRRHTHTSLPEPLKPASRKHVTPLEKHAPICPRLYRLTYDISRSASTLVYPPSTKHLHAPLHYTPTPEIKTPKLHVAHSNMLLSVAPSAFCLPLRSIYAEPLGSLLVFLPRNARCQFFSYPINANPYGWLFHLVPFPTVTTFLPLFRLRHQASNPQHYATSEAGATFLVHNYRARVLNVSTTEPRQQIKATVPHPFCIIFLLRRRSHAS